MEPAAVIVEQGALRLAARVSGQGRDIVMIPSHGRGAADFDDLCARLVPQGYRTIALDPRGVGQSSGPVEGVTLHDLAGDAALVVERLCSGPVHVLGHANGQRIARCLAADRPDLVDRLVLLACGGKLPLPPEWELYPRLYDTALPEGRRLEVLARLFFAPGADASVWLDGWWQAARSIQDAANAATPLEDWWEGGTAPMLVIQGSDDIVAPPGNGHLLRQALGARVALVDLPGVGHAMLPERPEAIAALVADWLAGRAAAGG
ncbi:MAG: alpha/beta hydrolase [Proteobacteria bacterium]|nr:alpha/beta hydrolase [Pseudomonadota bacterium]MDA0951384.1 alpha/beta hydrolase [Pseudomonadota bacterium]